MKTKVGYQSMALFNSCGHPTCNFNFVKGHVSQELRWALIYINGKLLKYINFLKGILDATIFHVRAIPDATKICMDRFTQGLYNF